MYAIHMIFTEIMVPFPFFIGNPKKENVVPGQENNQQTRKQENCKGVENCMYLNLKTSTWKIGFDIR